MAGHFWRKGHVVLFGCNFLGFVNHGLGQIFFFLFFLLAGLGGRKGREGEVCVLVHVQVFSLALPKWLELVSWSVPCFVVFCCFQGELINLGLIFSAAFVQEHEAPREREKLNLEGVKKCYFWFGLSGFCGDSGLENCIFFCAEAKIWLVVKISLHCSRCKVIFTWSWGKVKWTGFCCFCCQLGVFFGCHCKRFQFFLQLYRANKSCSSVHFVESFWAQ